jgi:hypothetical protein
MQNIEPCTPQVPHPTTKWEVDVQRLMAEIRVSRGPSGKLIRLLQKIGCVTNSHSDWMEFKEPRDDRRALVIEALAFASGVYAQHHLKGADSIARLTHAVAELNAWEACITPPKDAHAFVRNGLLLLDRTNSKTEVLHMFSAWLRPENRPYRTKQVTQVIIKDVLTDLFGEHWWMFNAPVTGKRFDPNIVIHQRPAFLPDLIPAGTSEHSLVLPEMDLG